MHEDYQLAYCPIAYIAALAFADDAFENPRLTPELSHKLRVPKRLHVLPLQFTTYLFSDRPDCIRRCYPSYAAWIIPFG
jgi:hypothetical protein